MGTLHAGIDIGTNTILMVIGEKNIYEDHVEWKIIDDIHRIPRLGEGLINNHTISESAIVRAAAVLNEYKRIIIEREVRVIRAVATSAMREAQNQDVVKHDLESALGHPIEIIDGITEGKLTFTGTVGSTPEQTLLIDIGGGSTEFVIGKNGKVSRSLSVDIGVVRLTEQYAVDRPLPSATISRIRKVIKESLEREDFQLDADTVSAIGVAGTPTSLAMLKLGMEHFDGNKIDSTVLTISEILDLTNQLLSKSTDELHQLKGIEPRRADVLPVGALILLEAMRFLHLTEIRVSTKGLRYGAMVMS